MDYNGKLCNVIHIRNVSKMINKELLRLKVWERKIELREAELFTSTLSHEIRTPLGCVLFYVQTLQSILKVYLEG